MSERKTFQVGFYVVVEVEAYSDSDAFAVALGATQWPLSRLWSPVEVTGELNNKLVQGKITYAMGLMATPSEPTNG